MPLVLMTCLAPNLHFELVVCRSHRCSACASYPSNLIVEAIVSGNGAASLVYVYRWAVIGKDSLLSLGLWCRKSCATTDGPLLEEQGLAMLRLEQKTWKES